MELLQSYSSDSEDSVKNIPHHPENSSKKISANFDFFNLQNAASEDTLEPTLKVRKVTDSCITMDSGETLTIPGSDFWKPIETEIKNQSIKGNTAPIETEIKNQSIKGNTATSGSTYCGPNSDQETSYCKSLSLENQSSSKLNKTCQINDLKRTRNAKIVQCDSHIPQRKLFEIHGKVKPWLLNQNIVCKIPHQCEQSWQGHNGSVNKVKWCSPRYSHLLLTVSMDTTIKIWNVWSSIDKCVRTLRLHSKGVQDCDWNNTGATILTCSYDKNALVTDVETGTPLNKFSHQSHVTCGKFHPHVDTIVLTGALDEILAWDIRQKDGPIHRYSYKDKIGQIQDVVFSRDGKEFFSTSDLISQDSADRNIMAWDFDMEVVKSNQIYQERYSCTCLKLHPVDSNLLAQSHGNYIAQFSSIKPYKMNKSLRYEGHKLGGYKIGFDITPDGRYVISGDAGGKICNYDYRNGRLLQTLFSSVDVTLDIAFHPLLPSTLACCGWNGSLEIWK